MSFVKHPKTPRAFSGTPLDNGHRSSLRNTRQQVEGKGEPGHARRDAGERSGRIFTRRISASAPHNASVIGDPVEQDSQEGSKRQNRLRSEIRACVQNKSLRVYT